MGKASGGGWAAVLHVVMSAQAALEVKCYMLNAHRSYVDDQTLRNMDIGSLYYFLKTRMTFHKVTGCGLFL